MGYAINKNSGAFRAVDCEKDLLSGETYSEKPPEVRNDPMVEAMQQIQSVLDAQAQSMGYDNMLSAVSYLNDPHPQFANDAAKLLAWRSACWVAATGAKKAKSVADVIKLLPKFEG